MPPISNPDVGKISGLLVARASEMSSAGSVIGVADTFPAIWHNSGGYADPVTYRDELMKPMAERLGIL